MKAQICTNCGHLDIIENGCCYNSCPNCGIKFWEQYPEIVEIIDWKEELNKE